MPSEEKHKRIAKNTLMLYTRQMLILLISLYTVRVVLNTLGVADYGIYNLIVGVVALLSFLGNSTAAATQRFFSFALGKRDFEKLAKTFTVNWIIYGIIAIVAFVLLETVGAWFVNQQLHLPPERLEAAQWVYHFSILTFIATIFTTPFMAIIIAHEDMHIYAYISISDAALRLCSVFLLLHLPWDKLEVYGVLIFAASIVNTIIYIGICTAKYRECQFRRFYWDKEILHEIIGFTGWTLFGQLSTVTRNQAVTILLNQTFNPIVVAARAIATNITDRINVFSNDFNVGLYPQIIKAYASRDKQNMISLIFNGSKITFFLMWGLALPMFLEMETLLRIWLKNPPPETALFTRLALVEVLINSISLPFMTAARAPGKMKAYELTLGTIQIAIFAASWIVLKMGGAAYSVFVIAIAANIVLFIVRLLIVKKLIDLSIKLFFRQVAIPASKVILLSATPSLALHLYLPKGPGFASISILSTVLFTCLCMYFFGLDKTWRKKMRSILAASGTPPIQPTD